ncbi:hypothetical protein [Chitinivorax sp. B]|uniref:hypothetical protein n=1 Tax=Chitinivorax sp. B TaxID=2502235 RepID=UPI0010F73607|nr:hypothetical protein [Chitinivorax sp. B]
MNNAYIHMLIKTFDNEVHLEHFLNGSMYMNPLSYFVKLEDDNTGRLDRHEGLSHWLQPSDIKITLNFNGVAHRIESMDLASPVSIQSPIHLAKNIFCMHAVYTGKDKPSEFSSVEGLQDCFKLPEENGSLGKKSVIIYNAKKFKERIMSAAKDNGFECKGNLVEYYDSGKLSHIFKNEEILFRKHLKFSHQQEYRVVLDRGDSNDSPYTLEIGSLHDIAFVASIADFNKSIQLSYSK